MTEISSGVDGVLSAVRISQVWAALGGDPPRHGRARAFYRDGDNGQAVSINDSKGVWFDHVHGAGGGVLDLVQHARGGDRQSALHWVADLAGVALNDAPLKPEERRAYAAARRQHVAEERESRWWAMAGAAIADELLESMNPCDPDRALVTALLTAVRTAPLDEYRAWREQFPELTAALVHAGEQLDERLQRALAAYLISEVQN